MKETLFNETVLINYQRICRNIIAVMFACLTVIYIFDSKLADKLALWVTVAVLAAILGCIVIFVIQFQKAKLYRFSLLSYLLGFLLLSTVILKFWIL